MRRRMCSGFTLVELLVVIAIIGILVSLTLPAVMQALESSRRLQCEKKLSQLSVATIEFESARGRFPGWQEIVARDAAAPIEFPAALPGGNTNKIASWPVLLLPYLDQRPLYGLWDDRNTPKYVVGPGGAAQRNDRLAHHLPIFYCPSRPTRFKHGPFTSFVASGGYYPQASDPAPLNAAASKGPPTAGFDYWDAQQGHNGVFVDRVPIPNTAGSLTPHQPARLPQVTFTDLRDGASNILFYSESLVGGDWSQPGLETLMVWLYATPASCPPSAGQPAPTQPVVDAMLINGLHGKVTTLGPLTARPSSRHPGGVNAVFADGHTTFLRSRLDYHVYQQLMTTDGLKSEMPCPDYVLRASDFEN